MKGEIIKRTKEQINLLCKIGAEGFDSNFKNFYLKLLERFDECISDDIFAELGALLVNPSNSINCFKNCYSEGIEALDNFYEKSKTDLGVDIRDLVLNELSTQFYIYV